MDGGRLRPTHETPRASTRRAGHATVARLRAARRLATARAASAPELTSRADRDLHPNIGRRNCDAAVERSPTFEALDELRSLLFGDAVQLERELHGVEYVDIG